jgi:hypothetical protein
MPSKAWISLRIRKGSHAKAPRRKGAKERRDEEGVKKSSSLRVSPKIFATLRLCVSPKKKGQCPRKCGSVYESGRDLTPRRKGAKERRREEVKKASKNLQVSA